MLPHHLFSKKENKKTPVTYHLQAQLPCTEPSSNVMVRNKRVKIQKKVAETRQTERGIIFFAAFVIQFF